MGHKKQTMHIQCLKKYLQRTDTVEVKRVTTVLEPDMQTDSMGHMYTEVVVKGKAQATEREKDVQE